jgi:hypothetical protein
MKLLLVGKDRFGETLHRQELRQSAHILSGTQAHFYRPASRAMGDVALRRAHPKLIEFEEYSIKHDPFE